MQQCWITNPKYSKKNNIVAIIQRYPGCQQVQFDRLSSIGSTIMVPSESIFSISDIRTHNKTQITEDIVSELSTGRMKKNRQNFWHVHSNSFYDTYHMLTKLAGNVTFIILEK
ncbi:hypothetical protein Glove_174g184 [Diversispora epigaea]|uniref:Uncharacterized protein n=1 Tax=Diversispora epigaea TaxID=1348612 RepID=A0A397IP29_9GLOM|nr:hypothetical protein Glove_174g184 [Diversispora epigaea]